MGFGNIAFSIDPQRIHYAEAEFSQLIVREVYDGNYPNGLYHIKSIKNINTAFLANFLKKEIPGELGLVDPDSILNIEFPIYLKAHGNRSSLVQDIELADAKLDKFIKNRQKGGN